VTPDASVELKLTVEQRPVRLELLIEFVRGRGDELLADCLRGYDGLLSGWAPIADRYRRLGSPPIVVFVCEDEQTQSRLVALADRVLTARLAKPGAEESEWPCPGRRATLFALERDVHSRSLEALALSEHPPEARVRIGGPGERHCVPRRLQIIDPQLLTKW
jgi:hypothetical protein